MIVNKLRASALSSFKRLMGVLFYTQERHLRKVIQAELVHVRLLRGSVLAQELELSRLGIAWPGQVQDACVIRVRGRAAHFPLCGLRFHIAHA